MVRLRQLTSALLTALAALLGATPGASAQEFPSRIVRIVVA